MSATDHWRILSYVYKLKVALKFLGIYSLIFTATNLSIRIYLYRQLIFLSLLVREIIHPNLLCYAIILICDNLNALHFSVA